LAGVTLWLDWRAYNGNELLIPPVYILGLAYVYLRVTASRTGVIIRSVKLITSMLATAIAPFVFCQTVPIFDYARAYGWADEHAFGSPGFLTFIAFLGTFFAADLIDIGARVHRYWKTVRELKLPTG
jgi:hypothetical protein